MNVKTSELTGTALDWAVAQAEGLLAFGYRTDWERFAVKDSDGNAEGFMPSTNWAQGGPIIERERIELNICGSDWRAVSEMTSQSDTPRHYGPTPLIAAMRCLVASRLGDEVDVPDDLVWDELIYEKGDQE